MGAFRERVTRSLESGSWDGPVARVLSRAWSEASKRSVVRPAVLPASVERAICVGGATLGGSGKTRLAIAIAKFLKEEGESVAFVTHGYGAKGWRGLVKGDEEIDEVGDEALLSARRLTNVNVNVNVPVFLSRSRQESITEAAEVASVLVIDGPLKIPGDRVLSVLAVDKHAPWGAGEVPPLGDLRAPREALEKIADVIVPIDSTPSAEDQAKLKGKRVALFTAIARPARLIKAMERIGINLTARVHAPDHGPLTEAINQRLFSVDKCEDVDLWALTEKCSLHLEHANLRLKKPCVVLDGHVAIPPELMQLLS
jgi:tetraacyldisaccharide 4'-kinase